MPWTIYINSSISEKEKQEQEIDNKIKPQKSYAVYLHVETKRTESTLYV